MINDRSVEDITMATPVGQQYDDGISMVTLAASDFKPHRPTALVNGDMVAFAAAYSKPPVPIACTVPKKLRLVSDGNYYDAFTAWG